MAANAGSRVEKLNILVVGSGGREHALVWKIAESRLVDKIFATPGNPGISELAECFKVKADDVEGLVKLAEQIDADLVVVGPEVPLSLGLADRLEACGRKVFGPVRDCARLESSKAFSKQIMQEAGVPTAWAKIFDDAKSAQEALLKMEGPIVVKLDGLAAGKGVVVADTTAEASVALSRFSGASSAGRVSARGAVGGRRNVACFASATGNGRCLLCRLRTTRGRWRGTGGQTPGVWGPSRRRLLWPCRRLTIWRSLL